ncbi:TPA: YadA-like family protein [Burkholderia cepacia]|nr:YadA-like family protein [Burkholderia cepacia]HDR9511023.1 YadA-like family protein [Burkholderia cepacia]
MNKTYKTVWNEAFQAWVVVSEITSSGRNREGNSVSLRQDRIGGLIFCIKPIVIAISMMVGNGLFLSTQVYATGEVDACANGGGSGFQGQQVFVPNGATGCNGTVNPNSGVVIRQYITGTGSEQAYLTVGQVDPVTTGWNVGPNGAPVSAGGMVRLGGISGIFLDNATSLTGHQINNLAPGVAPTDAVNVSQLTSLSTSINTNGIMYFHANSTLPDSTATGTDSVAIGPGAIASINSSVALGAGATTTAAVPVSSATVGGMTFSGFAGAAPVGVVSVGAPGSERQIQNVAAGQISATSTDAVNGSQLFTVASGLASLSTSTSTGISSLSTSIGSLSTGVTSLSTSTSTAISSLSTSTSTTIGSLSTSASTGISSMSTSITNLSTTLITLSTSINNGGIGGGTICTSGCVAIGPESSATGENSTAVGDGSLASGKNSKADGNKATASGDNSTAIGQASTASGLNSTAEGQGAKATGKNSKANGQAALAAGDNSTAIGQAATAVQTNDTALGQGALAKGPAATALGAQASATAPNAVALGAGSIATEANTVSVGSAGNERRITNVAPGINPTDAVNMSQLGALQSQTSDIARKAYSGIAGVAALAMIPEVDQGKTLAVGVGWGHYQGYSAGAIGISARITQNLKLKGGVSTSGSGGTTMGAGISYQW